MAGYSTKNKTFRNGELKDANVSVIGDGYGGKANYAGVDGYGNVYVTTHEGFPIHKNGTANTSPVDVTFPTSTNILIHNKKSNDCACVIQVSFDGGTNYFDICRKGTLTIEAEIKSFKIKSNQNGCDYQALITTLDC